MLLSTRRRRIQKIILILELVLLFIQNVSAFQIILPYQKSLSSSRITKILVSPTDESSLSSSATASSNEETDDNFVLRQKKKDDLLEAISKNAINGVTENDESKILLDDLTRRLEEMNPTINPARSEIVEGTWRVQYSTAPPPSNGRLGPLVGTALQSVDLKNGLYANELLVGDNTDNPWLSAVLLADWDEILLNNDNYQWKVNFRTISLRLFGRKLFTKEFDEGTSRIWITTYIDDTMRIVRAGVTESEAKRLGKSADQSDYYLFVMTRDNKARKVLGDIIPPPPKATLFDVLADPAKFMDDDD